MSGFPIIDLVIGMIFIYFILSIICSSATELWFSMLNTRAKILEKWLKQIFDAPALNSNGSKLIDADNQPISVGQSIMDHCMVTALSKKGKSTTYIDAENFVSALLDKITITPATAANAPVQLPPENLPQFITAIENSTVISGELKRTILQLAHEAKQATNVFATIPAADNITNNISVEIKSDLDQFRSRLENWYNTNADRLTGTMKRKKAVPATLVFAVILTIGLNADSVKLSKYLYTHQEQTKQLADKALSSYNNYSAQVKQIANYAAKTQVPDTVVSTLNAATQQLNNDIDTLNSYNLPLGWKSENISNSNNLIGSALNVASQNWAGWLVTILAMSMGAPFWFDMLNKVANLRGAGPKPAANVDGVKRN